MCGCGVGPGERSAPGQYRPRHADQGREVAGAPASARGGGLSGTTRPAAARVAPRSSYRARREDGPDSDIDLLVDLKSDDILRLLSLQRRLRSWSDDRDVHLVLLSDAEEAPALLADALREGRVIVDRGDHRGRLLGRGKAIFEAAEAADEATSMAAWPSVYEASRRLGV